MKRKVARVSKVRLSPNEEAILVKNEYERRRKLRLQQVREQERNIALQIRQEVKQRKEEQLQKLAEQLKAEWLSAQAQKAALLEKMYVSSLEAVGEGHRQAKENEPDLKSLAEKVAVYKQRAVVRHRDALRELKFQKDKEKEEQTRYILARKHALLVEKERASKIASLPPPSPDPIDIASLLEYYSPDEESIEGDSSPEVIAFGETITKMKEYFKWDTSQMTDIQRKYFELFQVESPSPSAIPRVLPAYLDAFTSVSQNPDSQPPAPKRQDRFYKVPDGQKFIVKPPQQTLQ
ncbi:centrosomal protein of 295 kDa-like [Protopterus annectens]|uniref:centrosomal protein of 295 kDa-like n=1 Tax=Protopterus annectens TaxID=7888 RepID=UPI001CFB80DA|nr:centrosomal protein of 295 kDa-like [Protopterus annectens]